MHCCPVVVCSSAHRSLLVLSGQSSGGETPGHQYRITRELITTDHQPKATTDDVVSTPAQGSTEQKHSEQDRF